MFLTTFIAALVGSGIGLLHGFLKAKGVKDGKGRMFDFIDLFTYPLIALVVGIVSMVALPFISHPIGSPLFAFLAFGSLSFVVSLEVSIKWLDRRIVEQAKIPNFPTGVAQLTITNNLTNEC